ncbi:MAG: hypothetical protein KGL39_22715 [Patescibacteria group bacterium]|nr:hypothetical protein [Patescibacteria group bacterium]
MAEQAHAQAVPVPRDEEVYPPHPPREDTPEYRKTHDLLIHEQDRPCFMCGVKLSDIKRDGAGKVTTANPLGAIDLETHHFPVQREFVDAVDPVKAAKFYEKVKAWLGDDASAWPPFQGRQDLVRFVDSPHNMLVLCDKCHRDPKMGIHHAAVMDWIAGPQLLDGYVLVTDEASAAKTVALDEQIVDAAVPESERA